MLHTFGGSGIQEHLQLVVLAQSVSRSQSSCWQGLLRPGPTVAEESASQLACVFVSRTLILSLLTGRLYVLVTWLLASLRAGGGRRS